MSRPDYQKNRRANRRSPGRKRIHYIGFFGYCGYAGGKQGVIPHGGDGEHPPYPAGSL